MKVKPRSKPVLSAMAGGAFGLMAWMACVSQACAAGPIYKCTDGDGSPAYQDRPCAYGLRQQRIAIRPPPPHAAGPSSPALAPRTPSRRTRPSSSHRLGRTHRHGLREPRSWECRVANGEVFYRHAPCPKTVNGSSRASLKAHQRGRSRVGALRVVGHPIARSEACRMINATTVSDRFGHLRDEQVSTYERNLGRDPCRRY
ncbi:MAG: DUF4124 domain-containing protein [Rhodanobacteraceae bacterium]